MQYHYYIYYIKDINITNKYPLRLIAFATKAINYLQIFRVEIFKLHKKSP